MTLLDLRAPLADDVVPIVLEGTAAAIWRAADDATDDAVVDSVAETFAVPADEVRDSVMAFLAELSDRGLLQRP